MQRFVRIGAREDLAMKWAEEAILSIEKEPTEQELLMSAIKNFTKEKKASYCGGFEGWEELDGANG